MPICGGFAVTSVLSHLPVQPSPSPHLLNEIAEVHRREHLSTDWEKPGTSRVGMPCFLPWSTAVLPHAL